MPDTPEAASDLPFHHPPFQTQPTSAPFMHVKPTTVVSSVNQRGGITAQHVYDGAGESIMSRMVLNPTFISDPPGSLTGVPETFAELVYMCFGIRYASGNLLDASCNGEPLIRVSTDGVVYVRGEEVARITRDDIVRCMAKNGIVI